MASTMDTMETIIKGWKEYAEELIPFSNILHLEQQRNFGSNFALTPTLLLLK